MSPFIRDHRLPTAFAQTPFADRNSRLWQTVPCLYFGLNFLYTLNSTIQKMQPGKQKSFTGGNKCFAFLPSSGGRGKTAAFHTPSNPKLSSLQFLPLWYFERNQPWFRLTVLSSSSSPHASSERHNMGVLGTTPFPLPLFLECRLSQCAQLTQIARKIYTAP